MNKLAKVRTALKRLLALYETASGLSADDYCDEPLIHPMAEGKYLSAVSELSRAGLIRTAQAKREMEASLTRLEELNLAKDAGEACWGLGFGFRDAPADEPYVITTAIVAAGLLDLPAEIGRDLATRALRWLHDEAPRTTIRFRGRPLALPVFSPHIPELITNVATAAAAVLHRGGMLTTQGPVIEWIRDQYRYPVGWPYSPNNHRIDLLHQCYILNGLADLIGSASIEEEALCMIGVFRAGPRFLDKLILSSRDEAVVLAAQGSTESYFMLPEGDWLVRHADEARDWSLGELMVVASRLGLDGREKDFWQVSLRRMLELALPMLQAHIADAEHKVARFRHSMHLAHGVASALRSLRTRQKLQQAAT